jgi:Flp pilus assembly pilin Flp
MAGKFRIFLKDESAATAIEYGLIAVGIAVAIISVTKASEQTQHYIHFGFVGPQIGRLS